MDIRVLQYFLAVAREGSITRAAQTLNITQPPLSRQLKELEEELGKKLFIRGSKRITLTEDGMLLQKRAEELIELFEKTKEEIRSADKNVNGEVYIGSGETDGISFLSRAAQRLQENYPLIHYHIYSGDASFVTEHLDRSLIDFGLLLDPVDITKYDYIRLPVRDTWGVLMRRDSPLAAKDHICAEDLWDKPLLLSNQTADSSEMSAWLKKDVSKLNIVATYELLYNASHFVKSGLGYALALDKIINTAGDPSLCFRPLSPALETGLCFVWKKRQRFSRAANLFLKEVQKELET